MRQIGIMMLAYLLGSVPFGLIVGKLWKGVDIRKVGSGNIGATNTLRALGPGPAAVVFLLDVLKGYVPVLIAKQVVPQEHWIVVLVALITILGHTLSLFLRFKGGKGVATSLGAIIGLDVRVAVIGFGIWILCVALTKYVSLASVIAAASIPTMMFAFHLPWTYRGFAILAAAFVILKHRSNIDRLLHGKEARWGERVKVGEGGQC